MGLSCEIHKANSWHKGNHSRLMCVWSSLAIQACLDFFFFLERSLKCWDDQSGKEGIWLILNPLQNNPDCWEIQQNSHKCCGSLLISHTEHRSSSITEIKQIFLFSSQQMLHFFFSPTVLWPAAAGSLEIGTMWLTKDRLKITSHISGSGSN